VVPALAAGSSDSSSGEQCPGHGESCPEGLREGTRLLSYALGVGKQDDGKAGVRNQRGGLRGDQWVEEKGVFLGEQAWFLFPTWKQKGRRCKKIGCHVGALDSDGLCVLSLVTHPLRAAQSEELLGGFESLGLKAQCCRGRWELQEKLERKEPPFKSPHTIADRAQ
jgi:hypothetical protein